MSKTNMLKEDIGNKINYMNVKKEVFREFVKNGNDFTSTDVFFLSEEVNNDYNVFQKIQGVNDELTIEKINNQYIIFYHIEYDDYEVIKKTKNIDLVVLKDYNVDLNIKTINGKKLIQENKLSIDDSSKILEELYYNNDYSSKINISSPRENKSEKKYLFKIKKNSQLNKQCNEEFSLIM